MGFQHFARKAVEVTGYTGFLQAECLSHIKYAMLSTEAPRYL